MRHLPRHIIVGSLLLAGCSSVEPAVVVMHGDDPSIASGSEAPFLPPPDLSADAAAHRPESAPLATEHQHQHQHQSHAAGEVAATGASHPAADHSASDHSAADHLAADEPVFVCPMHPEVVSHEAGTCPKCGMSLERSEGPK